MPPQPAAPDWLPKYLADGIPKQDDETLRDIQAWINELLTYRQAVATEEIEADADETVETVEETGSGTVVVKRVSCGKDNCACQDGELHGPYKYIVRRQGGDLNWEYKGPVNEPE